MRTSSIPIGYGTAAPRFGRAVTQDEYRTIRTMAPQAFPREVIYKDQCYVLDPPPSLPFIGDKFRQKLMERSHRAEMARIAADLDIKSQLKGLRPGETFSFYIYQLVHGVKNPIEFAKKQNADPSIKAAPIPDTDSVVIRQEQSSRWV